MNDKNNTLEEYLKFRSLRNHSKRALSDIKNYVGIFIKFSNKPLNQFDEKILIDYMQSITPKYSIEMLNKIKSSYIKNFIKWFYADWSSRFRNLDSICKTEKAPSRFEAIDMLNEKDVEKLIQEEESKFWKTYFMTLFYSASRPSEVCNLKWSDIEFTSDGAFITIFSKKNKKSFIKFVPENVSSYLKKSKEKNNSDYVFLNENTNKPISEKGAYWRIRELSKKVLNKQIDLYTIRHSIATILYNKEGIKDTDIAKQCGHSSSMKGKYNHPNRDKLKEIARKIYISPEELPSEKKSQIESHLLTLSKVMQSLLKKQGDLKFKVPEELYQDLMKIGK